MSILSNLDLETVIFKGSFHHQIEKLVMTIVDSTFDLPCQMDPPRRKVDELGKKTFNLVIRCPQAQISFYESLADNV